MLKRISLILLLALGMGCAKHNENLSCKTKVCTDIFAIVSLQFVDNTGKPVPVQNFSAVNQRTHLNMMPAPQNHALRIGYFDIADDNMKSQLSTEGDDVLVTGTNPNTNQTKATTLKISGGCNCHVNRLSGPDTLAFN
jgi:hypothetical protein